MSGPVRKKLGPVKKRLIDQIDEAQKFLSENVKLDNLVLTLKRTHTISSKINKNHATLKELETELSDLAKDNEAENEKLESEVEEFVEIELNANDVLADLEGFMHELETVSSTLHDAKERQEKLALQEKELHGKLALQEKIELLKLDKLMAIEKETQMMRLKMEQAALENKLEKTEELHKTHVKLPKLDLMKFDGDMLQWQEFWDSFNSAIHLNKCLHPVDKLNYLRSQLVGDAHAAIAGLSTTNDNYNIAIEILKMRFGNKEIIISSHYIEMMNLPSASDDTSSLRDIVNKIEKHFRSLEVLGETIENSQNVTLIQSKLPRGVLLKLHDDKLPESTWSVEQLRNQLNHLVSNREIVDLTISLENGHRKCISKSSHLESTTEVLFASQQKARHSMQPFCCYCNNEQHWSDQCQMFRTIEERERQMKDRCYICLKKGHRSKDCFVDRMCVYCKTRKKHHRSLCPKRFPWNSENKTHSEKHEEGMLTMGEQVLMQIPTETSLLTITQPSHDSPCEYNLGTDPSIASKRSLEDLWKPETIGKSDKCEDYNEQTHEHINDRLQFEDSCYQVKQSWNEVSRLPEQCELVLVRLKYLIKGLQQELETWIKAS